MANKAQMLEDRKACMTHKEIAEKHGVSTQYVSVVCAGVDPKYFHVITKEGCIYPNWRAWMNNEKCSRNELLQRMGYAKVGENALNLSNYMRGLRQPRKPYIDKLLKATGMTYEVMFAMEVDDGK